MEQKENEKSTMKISKDLLRLENKSPFPDSFLMKNEKKVNGSNGVHKTFSIPKSSVLDAAKAFLPKIAKANESIADMPPAELNIENADSDEEHVEMNVALFEYETSEESSEEETDDEEVCNLGEVDENNFNIRKPNRKQKLPIIEVLDSSQSDENT